jgi:hypothetical protein
MQMHGEKKPLPEIRAAIERKYRPYYPSMTPTPAPPK